MIRAALPLVHLDVGRQTLLVLVLLTGVANAETRLAIEAAEPARVETPRARHTPVLTPARIDLARFAAAPTRMFRPLADREETAFEALELRDNASRDWAADRDFELAVMWGALALSINHHVLDRNWDEAQVNVTFTRDL